MADAADEHDPIETITVVGGGDAGLMTALLLRQMNPDLGITVIDDFEEQIPEVGKSTISYIQNVLHNVLDIDKNRFVSEVKPIWKASVYFEDWCGRDPFHVPFDDLTLPPNEPGPRRFEELLYRYRTRSYRTLGTELAEQHKSPFVTIGNNIQSYDHVAYHLGTSRLNDFLRTLCGERDVDLVDDEITEVETSEGRIERVASDTTAYEGDLYVDATGFERQLMGALDNEFEAFDFPLDSALVAKTDLSLEDVVPATVINSGDYGWFWQIDTYDWRDLGYVYSSEFATEEEAATEFADRYDGAISPEDMQRYEFEAGYFEDAWVENCVAVGNAMGFVEPLQSTALTLNALLAEKLSELLADHHHVNHAGVRDIYNSFSQTQWDNIYDFVSVHYRYAPAENEFWEAMGEVNDPERLCRYVDAYHENGFNSHHEFDGSAGPTLFNQFIFYRVLHSVGLSSEFYEDVPVEPSEDVAEDIQQEERQLEHEAGQHLPYEEVYQGGIFE